MRILYTYPSAAKAQVGANEDDDDNANDGNDEASDIEDPIYDDSNRFHYIMTSKKGPSNPLPPMIELRTTYPCDPRFS